jgi:hypothetical protein
MPSHWGGIFFDLTTSFAVKANAGRGLNGELDFNSPPLVSLDIHSNY